MIRRLLTAALLMTCCFLFTGCFELEEQVSIDPTGPASALIKLRLTLPQGQKADKGAKGIEIKSDEIGKGIDGFESAKASVRELYGQIISEVTLKARSFKALAQAYNTLPREQGTPQNQEIKLDRLFTEKGFYQLKNKGKTILITRTFLPEKQATQKKKKDESGGMADMVGMMMGSMQMRLTLKVPSDVVSSNAEDQDGRTLHWVIPLEYVSTHKVVLQAEIQSTPELVKALF